MSESDTRKVGMAFVCFEDQLMNFSSNLRFSTPTSNWRALQNALHLGDYGGSFNPEYVLQSIDKFVEEVESMQLSENIDMSELYKKHFKITNAKELIKRLKNISIAAQVANTNVRVMIGAFIGDK